MSNRNRDVEQCFFRDLPDEPGEATCEELDKKYGCPDGCPIYEDPEMEAETEREAEKSIRGHLIRNMKISKKAMWPIKKEQWLEKVSSKMEKEEEEMLFS